jgi:hypothetical protein
VPTPFNSSETGYTATAGTVAIPLNADYDVNILDNPQRAKINEVMPMANLALHFSCGGFGS